MEAVTDFTFLGSKITADGNYSHVTKRPLLLGRKGMTNLDSVLKSRDLILPKNVCIAKAMFFLVVMYRCESWTIKKAEHQRIDAFKLWCLEKTLEISLDCQEIKSVNLIKGNQPWIFIGRTGAEVLILWPPFAKSQLIGKYPDAGKDRMQKEKGVAEDEMVR